jgi:hypothetical protein
MWGGRIVGRVAGESDTKPPANPLLKDGLSLKICLMALLVYLALLTLVAVTWTPHADARTLNAYLIMMTYFGALLIFVLWFPRITRKGFHVTEDGVELLRKGHRVGWIGFDSPNFRLNAYDYRYRPSEAGTQEVFIWRRELDTMAVGSPHELDKLLDIAGKRGLVITQRTFTEYGRRVSWPTTLVKIQGVRRGSLGHSLIQAPPPRKV